MNDAQVSIANAVFTGLTALSTLFTALLVFDLRADFEAHSKSEIDTLKSIDGVAGTTFLAAEELVAGQMNERWEYTVAALSDRDFENDGKLLGMDGWEIVSARRASDGTGEFSYEVIAKRRLPDKSSVQGKVGWTDKHGNVVDKPVD